MVIPRFAAAADALAQLSAFSWRGYEKLLFFAIFEKFTFFLAQCSPTALQILETL